MIFNSLHFIIFFPLVTTLYFFIPYRFRWLFLLAASYYFYMCFKPEYLILLLISTLVSYYTAIQMGKKTCKKKRVKYLIISLSANLGLLFFFKYVNFFNSSLNKAGNLLKIPYDIPSLHIILPIGISFYTFQVLGYSIDVFRGVKEPEKHLGIFALYVSFFPQLVAGPIERSTRLLKQFYKKNEFNYDRAASGFQQMFWGFFKKLVIADRLSGYVNHVYNSPSEYHGMPLLLATYFFTFQIYCDFSGYSDIAIGAARIMGYELMDNFNLPYFAKSVAEFWRRWHISLSTWFRDYLYIPLGGNRVTKWRWYYNIAVVFLLSGLWHGANWTFVVWGGLHGFYILCSIWTRNLRDRIASFFRIANLPIYRLLKICITFHLVVFAWIFFRANCLSDALLIVKNMFTGFSFLHQQLRVGLNRYDFLIALFSIVLLIVVQLVQTQKSIQDKLTKTPHWLRWPFWYTAMLSLLIFGKFTAEKFIYFQF